MEHAFAPVFSNLAKACEKQTRSREAELLWKIAEYFDGSGLSATWGENRNSSDSAQAPSTFAEFAAAFGADESGYLAPVRDAAASDHDRGALRMATWASKVNAIQKSIAERYAKKGESLVEGRSIFVCEACGFIFIGDEAPAVCPVCKAPAMRFSRIS